MADDILKKAIDSGITPFAVTTYRNKEKVFGIKTDDRRRHVYIIGKTGMGKTTLIENMVYSDIMAGHGVCYIDPHGDTAEKMLEWIPNSRINDVVYFNPADIDFPISFNVLEKVDPRYRHLVSAGLIGVFKKLWADSWGPRLEYILRNAILALLEYPDSTLLGVNRLLVDKNYRKKVVEKIQDPVVRSFWVDEFPKWNDRVLQEVISPIQNKVGQFLSTSLIRNVVGQVRSAVDLRKIMDEGKIIILNLSKGRIGEDASKLLGAMMVTKIQLAAMSRVDIPEEQRTDFYLYVDEFQNFATDSFADILSEARKYHLNLIIAHQYIEQLGEVVKPAVFGNVGTLIVFRVGAEDAEFLEKEFMPLLTQEDLVNLPKYAIYLKLMINGVASDPFSARGLPPVYGSSFGNEEKVIRASRERYAKPRDIVEDKIMRWSLGDKAETAKADNVQAPIVVDLAAKKEFKPKEKKTEEWKEKRKEEKRPIPEPKEQAKKTYPAVCDNCGTSVELTFVPDKSRPIYCKNCLKKSRRGELTIKEPRPVEIAEEPKPGISLAQLNKQTVDFKGRSFAKSSEAKERGRTELPRRVRIEPPQVRLPKAEVKPRIEPPPIREGKNGMLPKVPNQNQRIEPLIIRNEEVFSEKNKEIENEIIKEPQIAQKEQEISDVVMGDQELPAPMPAPQKSSAVDFLQQFSGSGKKDLKEGEEIEL